MAKSIAKVEKYEEYKEPSSASFYFANKDKKEVKPPQGIAVNQEIAVLVRGNIRSFSAPDQWDHGLRFRLDMTSCEVLAPAEPQKTLNDALKSAQKKV